MQQMDLQNLKEQTGNQILELKSKLELLKQRMNHQFDSMEQQINLTR